MPKSWNRVETWLTLAVLGAGAVVLGVAGLWIYVSATATPLHPDARSVPAVSPSPPPPQWAGAASRGRRIMRDEVAAQNLPGASVAVGVGGEVVWTEGLGWTDLETKTPVTPRTRFRIGSASTALTSAAAGLLLESGRLRLDEAIQRYVPEFPKHDWPVTLRQVMAHTAGIRSDGGDEGPLFSRHCDRPVDALPHVADGRLRFEPGTQYRYSNFGWIVVSAAIEAAAGEPFLAFMQRRVFDPLTMDDTVADSTPEPVPGAAAQYFPRFAADPRYGPDRMRAIDLSCYAGASVFLSTPSDLVRFGMAINGGALLRPATVQLLHTSQRLASGHETGHGLGWDLETVTLAGEPALSIGRDGEILGGIAASLITIPKHGLVVAVISNTSYADTPSMALQIAEAFAARR